MNMDILKNSLWLSVVCLIAVPAAGFAYGLGGIRIMSGLNEPLDAEIPLSDIKLHELNTLRFELLDVLDDTKRKQQQRVIPHPIHLAAEVKTRDGHAYLHVTSDNPLYANCSKKSFSCYNFFRFGVLANWRSRALENRVERSFPVIPRLDRALGKVNLLSTGGEQLEAEIELLDHHLDLSHLKVRLAPKQPGCRVCISAFGNTKRPSGWVFALM